MKRITLLKALWLALCCWHAEAQTYDTNNVVVQTFAGSGFSGYYDGQGVQTMFNHPAAVAADSSGNLLVWDYENRRIRRIAPDGTVSTFAGGGTGSLPGYGTNVLLTADYQAMTIDHDDCLWIAREDFAAYTFLKVDRNAYASVIFLGNAGGFAAASGVCVDSANSLYYPANNQIFRYHTNGVLEVFAGSGNVGSVDGNWIFTSFNSPAALAADGADNIYVWDAGNYLIRRINQNRDVVTIAGNANSDLDGAGRGASFSQVHAMCVDGSGNLILQCGSSIRKMTAATNVTTIAGSFIQAGYANGSGNLARFDCTIGNIGGGVCVSQGMIFIADASNQRIRNITFNPAPQLASPGNLSLSTYAGLKVTGVVGRTYRIESSADMTNWSAETSILLTSSPYLWMDPNPLGQKKFYRAFLLP